MSAGDLYGLKVGAQWTYLRSGGEIRWKQITGCEDVPVPRPDGSVDVVRAYVREYRDGSGDTAVQYLAVDDAGDVVRVRRDDVDDGVLHRFTTYDPFNPRLFHTVVNGNAVPAFTVEASEFTGDGTYQGTSSSSVADTLVGAEPLTVPAGAYETLHVRRDALSAGIHSWYASGIGEVREETYDAGLQVEELIAFTPGDELCDATSDVCANGACGEAACDLACEGSQICCGSSWSSGGPSCTNLARDPTNCGECGQTCGPGELCDQGACTCAPGTADCAGTGICQPVLADPANCGACGRACGGDAPICQYGVCVADCLSLSLDDCDGTCVDLQSSSDHCGACDQQCGPGTGTVTCIAGECISCIDWGLADCAGTCEDTQWSNENCGGCGLPCLADQVCVNGACQAGDGTCLGPCTGDFVCCSGSCHNPRYSDTNCGGCGVDVCTSTANTCEGCSNGACVPTTCDSGGE